MTPSTDPPWMILSFDLHASDRPEDIAGCLEWLSARRLAASFFVPTGMLELAHFREVLALLTNTRHEVGSHAHLHDDAEVRALRGDTADLAFLSESKRRFTEFFGARSRVFRSPFWCGLGQAARVALSNLGYRVDSSATPQRLGLLSNYPFENPWVVAPRRPHRLPGIPLAAPILEVPTSTFLVPVGTAAIGILSERGLQRFVAPFLLEARWSRRVGLVVQLHPSDLCASGPAPSPRRLRPRDLWPRRRGGLGLRHWLRGKGPAHNFSNTVALIDAARDAGLVPSSFQQVYEQQRTAAPGSWPAFHAPPDGGP